MTNYENIIKQWKIDNCGDVKANLHTSLESGLNNFSVACSALFQHPDVGNSSAEIKAKILTHNLYAFVNGFIWAEQGPVTEVCKKLVSGEYPFNFSKDLLDGAEVIALQEEQHSKWAYRLLIGIERHTGILVPDLTPRFIKAINETIVKEEELENLVKLMYVIVSEVLNFGIAEIVRHDQTVQKAVREFANEHENEERLHRVFFRKLFEEVWAELPSDLKRRIGVLTPEMIAAFLSLDQEITKYTLSRFPEEFPNYEQITEDLIKSERASGILKNSCLRVLLLFKSLGVFDDPKVSESFRLHNLMPDSFTKS
jgi:hypothetical protein